MATLGERFEDSAARVRCLRTNPTEKELLKLYGLYQQANYGDNRRDEPTRFYVKERAKWEAWEALQGRSATDAAYEYIEYVEKLIAKYGLSNHCAR